MEEEYYALLVDPALEKSKSVIKRVKTSAAIDGTSLFDASGVTYEFSHKAMVLSANEKAMDLYYVFHKMETSS